MQSPALCLDWRAGLAPQTRLGGGRCKGSPAAAAGRRALRPHWLPGYLSDLVSWAGTSALRYDKA